MSHHMAFLHERYTMERQVKDKNWNGENGLKAKLKPLLQSYSLEGLYGHGSCWRAAHQGLLLYMRTYRKQKLAI